MKTLREFTVIKNLNTSNMKLVDDDGDVSKLNDDGSLDPFGDIDGLDNNDDHAYRPDGTHDGLDDLDEIPFDEDDTIDGMEAPIDDTPPSDDPGLEDEEGIESDPTEDTPLDGEATPEDPDFQGVVRTVTGACLVYKRKQEDGTYEELWVLNVGKNMRSEVKIRRAILAGTDIKPQDVSSSDGTQQVETTTVGNVQFLRITGLPN